MGVDVSLGLSLCPFCISELLSLVARGTPAQRAGTSPSLFSAERDPQLL